MSNDDFRKDNYDQLSTMNEFIEYILQFGSLSQQQIDFISKKAKEVKLPKDDYFLEAGKVLKKVGFIIDGIVRVYYYSDEGKEITKIFLEENHLLFSLNNDPSPEYIQAATDCRLLVFSNKDWEKISNTIDGWEPIIQKIITKALAKKLKRVSPLVSQDATTRYLEFMDKYPMLANRIPLAYIASYLGITQQSLSRIRRNIR